MDITPKVWRVSKDGKSYKGAVNTFLYTETTDEMREEYNKILDDLYYVFVRDISEGKGWETSTTENIIDNGPYLIAEQAVEAGLLTGTMYPDEFKELKDIAITKGFLLVSSSPLTRSSYHADEDFVELQKNRINQTNAQSIS